MVVLVVIGRLRGGLRLLVQTGGAPLSNRLQILLGIAATAALGGRLGRWVIRREPCRQVIDRDDLLGLDAG